MSLARMPNCSRMLHTSKGIIGEDTSATRVRCQRMTHSGGLGRSHPFAVHRHTLRTAENGLPGTVARWATVGIDLYLASFESFCGLWDTVGMGQSLVSPKNEESTCHGLCSILLFHLPKVVFHLFFY